MVLRRRPFSEIRIITDWSVCYRIGTPGWRRLEHRDLVLPRGGNKGSLRSAPEVGGQS